MPLFAYSIAIINLVVNLLVTSPGRSFAAALVIIDIVDIVDTIFIQAATGAVFPIVLASSITALV
jgi:hypothetical protein